MSKVDKEKNRIKDEFDQIQIGLGDFDISNHLAKASDLPDLGDIDLYDYDSDLSASKLQSMNVLESLIDLYLGDIPQLKKHPYIKNKMKEDAMVYAEAVFLTKMTRKSLLGQLRQVDNGDNSARMHEVVNQTLSQVRENAKFLSGQRTELEKFYKTLRKDLGHDEIDSPGNNGKPNKKDLNDKAVNSNEEEIQSKEEMGDVTDNRKLNDMIKNAMMNNRQSNSGGK
jgi:hypothetical protein